MKHINDLQGEKYHMYLTFLKELVSIKTVYKDLSNVENGIQYCLNSLRKSLPDWKFYRDEGRNLLYINPSLNADKPILYLCAHIDTVDANKNEWHKNLDPFIGQENTTHIIGRGVNDCKAGIALILYMAFLLGDDKSKNLNLSFLISFKEEGNQGKTSRFYADNIGSILPISKDETCIVSLENTISIKTPYELAVYHREPGNFFVQIYANLNEAKNFLNTYSHWKPVVIRPVNYKFNQDSTTRIDNKAGHIATIKNSENLIYKMIMSDESKHIAIVSGDPEQTSVVQKDIYVLETAEAIEHAIILNYRGFGNENDIRNELKEIAYKEYSPFIYGYGSDQSSAVSKSKSMKHLLNLGDEELVISIQDNPGRSDSSEIWNSLSAYQKNKILPITFGPGHRSHVDNNGVQRKTHGLNEGFNKEIGSKTLKYFFEFFSYFEV